MTEAGSFTQRVLAELAPHTPQLACCRSALVGGMRLVSGSLAGDTSENASVIVNTTRLVAARAAVSALHAQGVAAHARRMAAARRVRYVVTGDVAAALEGASERLCCSRSRLRGAFLSAGRLTRPEVAPHLEIGC